MTIVYMHSFEVMLRVDFVNFIVQEVHIHARHAEVKNYMVARGKHMDHPEVPNSDHDSD